MEGWIKLHRKILLSQFGKNLELMGLFSSLLLMANHKKGFTSDGTMISPGQFMTSQKELAKRFKMDRNRMRRMLDKLSAAGQIEQHSNFQNTIITITNWFLYQSDEQRPSSDQAASEQRVNTNKNANNNKNYISYEFGPVFFEGVIDDPKKILPQVETQDYPKKPSLELANDRKTSTHTKLSSRGDYVAPEWLVIEYFNAANNKNLKQVDSNYKEIKARLKEGFTIDEMKLLIDYAAKVWSKDSFWSRLNRPSTLFNGKFNQYLDQAQNALKPKIDPFDELFGPHVTSYGEGA
jgi:uncharacterized phage protein (TIGR02220 family)